MAAASRNLWRDTRWRESGWTRARAVLAMGMVLGLGAVGTSAKWSQTVTAQTGLFTSASVDLRINGATPAYAFAAVNNVFPGTGRSGMIALQNQGGTDLKYLMDVRVAGLTTADLTSGYERGDATALGQNLTVDVFAGGTSNGVTCTGYTSQLVTQAPLTVGGDRPLLTTYRNVDTATTDSLCVRVSLASGAPVRSRVAQVGVTFTANAEIR